MNDAAPDIDLERAAWLRLSLTPGVGPATARRLLEAFGLPNDIFSASARTLTPLVGETLARSLAAPATEAQSAAIAATQAWLARSASHHLVTLADAAYPTGLLTITDPPPLLYASGRLDLLASPAVAIVGSRSATQQGAATAESFAAGLARAGLAVVSGLALGIDAAAHRGALKAATDGARTSTIGVVGTGIDIVYPTANRPLTEQLRHHGLVLSELPLGTPAVAHHFPRRNRLIAGLARGVLVVEAALRSGSLITARLAAEQGREVFAIPGSIHSPVAKGCHRLIKDGAKLVESVQDILEELRIGPERTPHRQPVSEARADPAGNALPDLQRRVLEALGHDPTSFDRLCERAQCAAGDLTAALLELELAQHVERLPGDRYQRLR